MFLGLGVGINRHLFSRGAGKLTPCLTNLIQRLDDTYQGIDGKWYSRDISGNGYDVELHSGCVEFNGVDNYISSSEFCYSSIPNVDFTIVCSITPDNYTDVLYSEANTGNLVQFFRVYTNSAGTAILVQLRNNSSVFLIPGIAFNTLILNGNYKIRYVDTNGNVSMYLDDNLIGTYSYTPTGSITFNNSAIGALNRQSLSDFSKMKVFSFNNTKKTFKLSENSGNTVYDTSGNGNDGTILGTLDDVRVLSPYARPSNQLDGYSKNGDAFVPPEVAPITVQGKTKGFNGSETVGYQPDVQSLKDVDAQFDTPKWYSGGSPIAIDLTTLSFDYESKALWFNNVSNPPYAKDWLVYSAPISGDCRTKTGKYVSLTTYPVIEGNYQVTEGDYLINKG